MFSWWARNLPPQRAGDGAWRDQKTYPKKTLRFFWGRGSLASSGVLADTEHMSVAGARTIGGNETTSHKDVGFGPGQISQEDRCQKVELESDDGHFGACASKVNRFAKSGSVLLRKKSHAAVVVHGGVTD